MWAAGPPFHCSEGRASLIIIWVIITEQRKRKRMGIGWREDGRGGGWWEKWFSFCLLRSSVTITHSAGEVLSLPYHPTTKMKENVGMLGSRPAGPSHKHQLVLLRSHCLRVKGWDGSCVALNLCENISYSVNPYIALSYESCLYIPLLSVFSLQRDVHYSGVLPTAVPHMTNRAQTWHAAIHLLISFLSYCPVTLTKSSQTVIFVQTQLPGDLATEADVYVGGGTRRGLCF